MDNETVNDVSRYVNVYHTCYTGNGICAPFNRGVLYERLRVLQMTDEQINVFCDAHNIPHIA